jgi:hypothetical protein
MGRDERDVQFLTYTTLDGNVIDLRSLTAAERAYFARCYEAFRHGMFWEDFTELSVGPTHLLLRDSGGLITPACITTHCSGPLATWRIAWVSSSRWWDPIPATTSPMTP